MSHTEIQGFCDDRFLPVKEAFEASFDAGKELGASFALDVKGEMVVDLWGGVAMPDGSKPWERDTIAPVMSSGKAMCALCGFFLLDRGLIDLDEPVAKYWPEFGAGGKERLPVRYLFTHASGVAGWDLDVDTEYLYDWDQAVAQLASQEPWWEPGTQSGYHLYTYGFLLGELVRRTTGKSIRQFFRDEVGDKLNVDFYFGVEEHDLSRIAGPGHHPPSHFEEEEDELQKRAMGRLSENLYRNFYDPQWLMAEIPASNGIANARGLATAGSILANHGSVNGQFFLSEDTARLAWQEQIYTHDLIMDEPVRLGLGFGISSKDWPMPFPNVFHWGGYGGSQIAMCPDNKASWAYVPNLFYGARRIRNDLFRCPKRSVPV